VTLIAQERAIDSVSVAALRCNGWVEGDPDRLAQAADIAQAAGLVDTWATVSEDLGVALAGAGRTAEAIEPLTAAAGYAEGIGAGRDVQRLESRLRELGIRRGRRGARARPSSGWASLTETERRVVDLAAEGLTNSEVGARLFISGRTVERHLTHVYGKLGISSRVELARIAAAH
jgi:DNA-binding CsgD family transcriptional regulator